MVYNIPMTVTLTVIIRLSVHSGVFCGAVHVMMCEPTAVRTTEFPATADPSCVKLTVDGGYPPTAEQFIVSPILRLIDDPLTKLEPYSSERIVMFETHSNLDIKT